VATLKKATCLPLHCKFDAAADVSVILKLATEHGTTRRLNMLAADRQERKKRKKEKKEKVRQTYCTCENKRCSAGSLLYSCVCAYSWVEGYSIDNGHTICKKIIQLFQSLSMDTDNNNIHGHILAARLRVQHKSLMIIHYMSDDLVLRHNAYAYFM
jgi:hypothetical protein